MLTIVKHSGLVVFLGLATTTGCSAAGEEAENANSDMTEGAGSPSATTTSRGAALTASVTTKKLISEPPCSLDVEAPEVDAHSPEANDAIAKGLPGRTPEQLCGPGHTVVVKSRYEVVTNTRGILTVRTIASGTLDGRPYTVLGPVMVHSFDLRTGRPLAANEAANAAGVKKIHDACVDAQVKDFVDDVTAKGEPPTQQVIDFARSTLLNTCDLPVTSPRVGSFSIEESGIRVVLSHFDMAKPPTLAFLPWSDLSGMLQGMVADFASGAKPGS